MNRINSTRLKHILIALLLLTCLSLQHNANAQSMDVPPTTAKLAEKFVQKDSSLFNAIFNTCDTKEIEAILAKDFVFYQDKGYNQQTITQSLDAFIDNIKKNFCDKQHKTKMRRELVKETIQVFPSGKASATQTGTQRFYIVSEGEKDKLVEESKFAREWQFQNGNWKMKKEMDYLVNANPKDEPADTERFVPDAYVPIDKPLYDEIVQMDSIYFNTYNTCDLEKMSSLMSDSLEFYHDKGGLTNSKPVFIESIKKNICGKVSRQLVKNSIEVYPINGYGAVEIGYHRFVNHAEGNSLSKPDKFIVIWQKKNSKWQIAKVVSLH